MLDVVLADDDPVILESMRLDLEDAGYAVRTATNGNEVLAHVRRRMPDLVITDIVMPEREGIETIMELRRTYPRIGVLAVSGRNAFYLRAALELGADAMLAKPFTTRKLLNVVTWLQGELALRQRPQLAVAAG